MLKLIKQFLRKWLGRVHNKRTVQLIEKHLYPTITKQKETVFHFTRDKERLKNNAIDNEIILRSAIATNYPDASIEKIYSVSAPAHHAECIFFYNSFHGSLARNYKQGFLTSKGRFVDRVEGLEIATKNNQIVKKYGNPDLLFSEDMWLLTKECKVFKQHYFNHWSSKLLRYL